WLGWLPAADFAGEIAPAFWGHRHPVLRWLGRFGKNLRGAVLVVVGVILALPGVPGQGLLTILIGLMFLDLPGKRAWERALVRRPGALRVVGGLRRRYR